MPKTPKFSDAIREAAEREGLGLEQYRRKHDLPNAHFYKLVGGRSPLPDQIREPLLKFKRAGVKHPLLDLVS